MHVVRWPSTSGYDDDDDVYNTFKNPPSISLLRLPSASGWGAWQRSRSSVRRTAIIFSRRTIIYMSSYNLPSFPQETCFTDYPRLVGGVKEVVDLATSGAWASPGLAAAWVRPPRI
jgi:hypothetical protein